VKCYTFSSIKPKTGTEDTHSEDARKLLKDIKDIAQAEKPGQDYMIGVIGYPNVGKSCLIEALKGFLTSSAEKEEYKHVKVQTVPGVVFATDTPNSLMLKTAKFIDDYCILPGWESSLGDTTKGNLYILLAAAGSIEGWIANSLEPIDMRLRFGTKIANKLIEANKLGGKVAVAGADGLIEADSKGKVTKIVLGKTFVNKLFDADKMDASTFADQFVKFYNIPRMDVSSDWKSWVYVSEDGAKLSISDEKTLILEKSAGKKSFD
jgi:hypothetical protein